MQTTFLLAVNKTKLALLLCLVILTTQIRGQMDIPKGFCGQNLWMPSKMGNNTTLNGQLETTYTELNQSGATTFRFGGTGIEDYVNYGHVTSDYIAKINHSLNVLTCV